MPRRRKNVLVEMITAHNFSTVGKAVLSDYTKSITLDKLVKNLSNVRELKSLL